MNIPILFSLIDPDIAVSFRPTEVLLRISRIHEAACRYANRKELAFIYDPFLARAGKSISDLKDWEVEAGGKILYHVMRKLKRLESDLELPGFGQGFQRGLLDLSIALQSIFEQDYSAVLKNETDPKFLSFYGEFVEYLERMHVPPIAEFKRPDERVNWSRGLQTGVGLFQNSDGSFPGETLATKRHATMIFLAPEISSLNTVEEVYQYLKKVGKGTVVLPADLESFKVACSRLGLQGRNYRRNNEN